MKALFPVDKLGSKYGFRLEFHNGQLAEYTQNDISHVVKFTSQLCILET